jgi:predicted PurR-regulated permease PerM
MDFTLFIISALGLLFLYYLINSINSLQKEIHEMKDKCINSNTSLKEGDLLPKTIPINDTVIEKMKSILNYAKNYI